MADGFEARLGPPIDVRPLFRIDRGDLVELLRDLAAADWERPTICPGWRVRDVVAHVAADDFGRLARMRDGYRGVGPREGEPLATFLHRINQEWVVAARRLSPVILTDLLAFTGAQIDELWRSQDLGRLGEPVSWAGDGPAPVWLDAARDFTEYWTHQQQIRDVTLRPRQARPELLGALLDTFIRALPHTLRHVDAPVGSEVEVTVTGGADGSWTATRFAAGWSLRRGPAGSPAASVTLDPDTMWRLCTRGISPEQARARAHLTGDRRLCDAAMRIVSIIY
jgi:uncharacterized protein (TIGR03083 family)